AEAAQLDTDAAMSQAAPPFCAGAAFCLPGGEVGERRKRRAGWDETESPPRRLRRRPSPRGEGKNASRTAAIDTWRRYEIRGRPAVAALRGSSAHHRQGSLHR